MWKRIWKYELDTRGINEVKMPIGAEILALQTQFEKPCLWVLVDETQAFETRLFHIFGTGQAINMDIEKERKYIGTYQLQGGNLVFHLFEY